MYLLNLDFLNHGSASFFNLLFFLRSVKHSDLLWHTPITTVVMSLGDNGQLSIINLCHGQNLTLVKSVCKTVPKSLFWAPTGVRVPRSEYVS